MELINIDEIIAEEMKNPKFAAEYHKLDAEFEQIKRDIGRDITADLLTERRADNLAAAPPVCEPQMASPRRR